MATQFSQSQVQASLRGVRPTKGHVQDVIARVGRSGVSHCEAISGSTMGDIRLNYNWIKAIQKVFSSSEWANKLESRL